MAACYIIIHGIQFGLSVVSVKALVTFYCACCVSSWHVFRVLTHVSRLVPCHDRRAVMGECVWCACSVCLSVTDTAELRPVVMSAGNVGVLNGARLSVYEQSTVNMTCQLDALPSPNMSALVWYKEGRLVFTGQYYVMSAVERHDAGEYQCVTWNTMTPTQRQPETVQRNATFELVVMCKNSSP